METAYEARNNYLFIKLTGRFDINRIKETIPEMGKELHSHHFKKIFLDMMEVTGPLEKQNLILEAYDLYELMAKYHPLGTMLCLVGTEEITSKHKFFEDVLTNRGFPAKVTSNREEGLTWLGVLPEEKSRA